MPTPEVTKNIVLNTQPLQTLQQLIEKSAKEFKKALPIGMRPERLVRIALTCIRQTPGLTQCTPNSFVGALLVSAQLGLEPMAGRAYILPFRNNNTGKTDAQFLVGYKGLADLFYRHEKSVNLAWGVVRANDEFEYEYGTNAKLRHRPAMKDRGDVLGYYVIAELRGGAKSFMYMSKEDCMEHGKKHSKTYDKKTNNFSQYSPWATDPDAMCLKTVLIQLAKLLPLSIELQRAISADETSREYKEGIDDALDIPTQDWNTEPNQELIEAPTMPQNKAETAISAPNASPIAKDTAPEPEDPENSVKPMPAPLTIQEALQEDVGKTIMVQGILSDWEVKSVIKKDKKTKAELTNYLILSEDSQYSMTITKWGGFHDELKLGDTVVFEDVRISEFQGTKKYLAQMVSLLKAKEEIE